MVSIKFNDHDHDIASFALKFDGVPIITIVMKKLKLVSLVKTYQYVLRNFVWYKQF